MQHTKRVHRLKDNADVGILLLNVKIQELHALGTGNGRGYLLFFSSCCYLFGVLIEENCKDSNSNHFS